MLPRLLFVVGMTIGVMAPLIWAGYVSVPVFRAVLERAGEWGQRDAVGTALRETPKPQSDRKADQAPPASEKAKPVPAEDVTSAPAPEKTLQGKAPQGAPDAPRSPDVVDLYSGPHIIIVCSELTTLQKLRMGCP
jgi:hypothetical protein